MAFQKMVVLILRRRRERLGEIMKQGKAGEGRRRRYKYSKLSKRFIILVQSDPDTCSDSTSCLFLFSKNNSLTSAVISLEMLRIVWFLN